MKSEAVIVKDKPNNCVPHCSLSMGDIVMMVKAFLGEECWRIKHFLVPKLHLEGSPLCETFFIFLRSLCSFVAKSLARV